MYSFFVLACDGLQFPVPARNAVVRLQDPEGLLQPGAGGGRAVAGPQGGVRHLLQGGWVGVIT